VALRERSEAGDDAFERLFFFAELLRALGVAPDARVFQLLCNVGQANLFGLKVKDTS
jgi:hypothetical protein